MFSPQLRTIHFGRLLIADPWHIIAYLHGLASSHNPGRQVREDSKERRSSDFDGDPAMTAEEVSRWDMVQRVMTAMSKRAGGLSGASRR